MDEVESLESMIHFDAAVHMNTTLAAGVSDDGGAGVNSLDLVLIRGHLDFIDRDNSDDGEECALWFPAFRTSAGMVKSNIAAQSDFYRVGRAQALKLASREVLIALGETVVEKWMERSHVICGYCLR